MKILTIGFTKKTAREFFAKLKDAGVKLVVDARLNNVSQLAGFTKKDDLAFFLEAIAQIGYLHKPELAPTEDILSAYKKKQIDWPEYERRFKELLLRRHVEDLLVQAQMDGTCLLCSEPTPQKCHRRLVAEYLREKWDNVEIQHL